MDFCRKTHNADFYASTEDIPSFIWDEFLDSSNVYLQKEYLSAIANSHKDIDFYYAVLKDENDKPIAFATIQIVDFSIESVQNHSIFSLEKWKDLIQRLSPKQPMKILSCGNIFLSGEHGVFIANRQNKQEVIKKLAKSVVSFIDANAKLKNQVKIFMIKDFRPDSLHITDELHNLNYYSFRVEPNMIMKIDEDWNSFTDYLAAMRTKFRVKAKKAMELSATLEVVDIDANNIHQYLNEMDNLYENVSSKASFNITKFEVFSFKKLKENLKSNFILKAYFLKNKMVGFLSAVINNNHLDAHFVGLDYSKNKEYAIYQRILYDYVNIAIQKKLVYINFGRTASEIKSSVGAEPQELTIYLRHKKSFPNKFLRLFLNRIEPTPFTQKKPFKDKSLVPKT